MRILLVLRGNYHAGQSEFVEKNHLKDFTLDLNELRFLNARYKQLDNAYQSLNYKNDDELHKILLFFLENRMKKGEFCILSAYNETIQTYKNLALKYRYKMFVINFDTPLTKCLENNLAIARKTGIITPTTLLQKTHLLLKKPPKKYAILEPENWQQCLFEMADLNKYTKVHHIGDIQGCYTVLKKYLKSIKNDEFYIFLGDYIDRGIENAKVIKYLMKIAKKPNVVLLEGNHERHLVSWGNGEIASSKEFNENTLKDFRKEKLTPKHARDFVPNLRECFFYEFGKKRVFCSHGGVNTLPKRAKNISFVPSSDFIYGIGGYEQSKEIAEQFCENTPKNTYQLFGHRNRQKLPIKVAQRCFLCEGKVDDGGHLRAVVLDKNGFHGIEIKNEVYRKR